MKYVFKSITASLLGVLCFYFSCAQQIAFSHYKLERGLPATLIMQDHKGYLWIASDGLFRFDGVDAIHFTNDPKNPASLVNNSIKSFAEDTDGSIWIGTLNGISHYYPFSNLFINYFHKENDTSSLSTNLDNIVFVDNVGTLWVGNRSGISRFNRKQQTFTHYKLHPYQNSGRTLGDFISSIIDDNTNNGWLWMASHDGIIHFRKSDGYAEYYYPSEKPYTINKLFMDSHHRLWMGTWGLGLGYFNLQSKEFFFTSFEKELQLGTTNIVFDIKEKPVSPVNSIFYVCTDFGFTSFELDSSQNKPVHPRLQKFLLPDPLFPNSIGGKPNSVFIDRQGIIWVATFNDLSYILPNKQVFTVYNPTGDTLGNINNITPDTNSRGEKIYWVSSWYSRGLMLCDSGFNHAKRINYFDNLAVSKNSIQINSVVLTCNTMWVASMDGLFMYDKNTKEKKVFNHNTPGVSIPSDRIVSLCPGNFHRLWIGTYNNGFTVLDLTGMKTIPESTSLLKQFSGKRVNVIYEDSRGFIWMQAGSELVKINENNFQFSVYKHISANLHSKAGGDVTGITEDHQHRLWIGNTEGLNLYNPGKDNFTLFTTADGLSNNNIESLACDKDGDIWIATAKGLNRLHPNQLTIKPFYDDDGIEKDDNLNCLLADGGRVLIGSNGFITGFRPSALIKNTMPPLVYINSVYINNDRKTLFINKDFKKVRLKYNENYFTIDFIALNFINAAQNKYAYKMEGIDRDFIQGGSLHKAAYTNVAPGIYTFIVKASNSDGTWNNTGASVIIEISPPYWKTWWFILVCSIIILFLMYALYRYRVEQLLKVERLRSKISTDLHDDIGSTLSSISILSDMVLKYKDDDNAVQMLQEIKDNSINLMEKMDDIVWSINPKNDTLENLMLRIKHFASQLFEAKNIDYTINISESISHMKLSMENRQHLYLIIKESINNIIKHAGCSYASIIAGRHNGELTVEIKDNGKGFDVLQESGGNGILSIRQRAKQMGAQLKISPVTGKGTVITIGLKIK